MFDYVIEETQLNDAHEILLIINTANREAFRSIIPEEHFREPLLSLDEFLERTKRMTFYVCRSEGRVVGVAGIELRSGKTGRVQHVYVLPDYQRRGVGTALVTHLERRAREIGLHTVEVVTDERAEWAVKFYKKLGYSLASKIENPWGFNLLFKKQLYVKRDI